MLGIQNKVILALGVVASSATNAPPPPLTVALSRPPAIVPTNSLTVSWSAVPGAIGYFLFYGTNDSFNPGAVIATQGATNVMTPVLQYGQRYWFSVAAYRGSLSNCDTSDMSPALSRVVGASISQLTTLQSTDAVNWTAVVTNFVTNWFPLPVGASFYKLQINQVQ